jgi:hypothetical protein
VETGIGSGVATSFLGAALIDNGCGQLYSIDLPPDRARGIYADGSWSATKGPGWAVPDAIRDTLGNRHTVVLEDIRTSLPRLLDELTEIDFFFHDDLHMPPHVSWELSLVWPRLAPDGILAADDINSAWLKFRRLVGDSSPELNLQRLGIVFKDRVSAVR